MYSNLRPLVFMPSILDNYNCPVKQCLEQGVTDENYIYIYIDIFTKPSARAGYDTRSIFTQSLTEFSFS